jgi:hypothetical protein
VVLDTQAAGSTVWTTANAANAAWTAAATALYIERRVPTDTANPFLVAARLKSDTTPWASVKARTVVATSTLDAFAPGALWFGVSAKSVPATVPAATSPLYRSASPVRGSARFDNLLVAMTLPRTLPKDIYGFSDVCVTPGATAPRAVWVKVVNASAVLSVSTVVSGLSANFPYTVTVLALLNGGLVSAASAPIEGTYFWARRMPPRQQRLMMWLDAKWMPAGPVATWPDASGNGHHAINTAAAARRPVTVHPTTTGYGHDFITPGAVTFTRANAQYLVSDADGVHLGGAGPMTIYWFARNRYTSSQLLVGRGAVANRLDTVSSGWTAAISSTSFDSSGFLSLRHGAPAAGSGNTGAALPVAAAQVRLHSPVYKGNPTMSSHVGILAPVMLTNGSSAGPDADAVALARVGQLPADYDANAMPRLGAMGLFRAVACNAPNCSTGSEAVFFDEIRPRFNNTYSSDPYAVTYAALGTNANLQPTPAVGTDLNLRIGGQPYFNNTATAYQGELLGLLIYNEAHDASTRSAVTSFYSVSGSDCSMGPHVLIARVGWSRSVVCSCSGIWLRDGSSKITRGFREGGLWKARLLMRWLAAQPVRSCSGERAAISLGVTEIFPQCFCRLSLSSAEYVRSRLLPAKHPLARSACSLQQLRWLSRRHGHVSGLRATVAQAAAVGLC